MAPFFISIYVIISILLCMFVVNIENKVMNVKITKEEHERLQPAIIHKWLFGSRLFGTHSEDSDFDYICIYDYDWVYGEQTDYFLPNIHSFQYDDKENNTQYVYMTNKQFWVNLYSGDGTMQTDIVMFSGDWDESEIMTLCRTYKIIKAYCGMAKRDMTMHPNDPKKRFHAKRSVYIAQSLLDGQLPKLDIIQTFKGGDFNPGDIIADSKSIRAHASDGYQNKRLHNYSIPLTSDSLLNKMLATNNIREFKY